MRSRSNCVYQLLLTVEATRDICSRIDLALAATRDERNASRGTSGGARKRQHAAFSSLLIYNFCKLIRRTRRNLRSAILNSFQMPQTVPTAAGYSPSFDYSNFQFDLSLLSDDYSSTGNHQLDLKTSQIKQEAYSPHPRSPTTYPSPPYQTGELSLSPNYSHEGSSPGYPTSPYYVPRSPQSAQFYPTSPESSTKQPVKREKSLDLLAILQESRWALTAETYCIALSYFVQCVDCFYYTLIFLLKKKYHIWLQILSREFRLPRRLDRLHGALYSA